MKMKKPSSEANSGAGDRHEEGRLGENRELMDKTRTRRIEMDEICHNPEVIPAGIHVSWRISRRNWWRSGRWEFGSVG
jgi:hypothetical protein